MKPIEIKIPKEVTQHKETIFFGLSARQFFCSVIAVAMAAGIYLLLHQVIGKEPASWLCMICAAPFAVAGFFSYNGLTFERFIWVWGKIVGKEIDFPEDIGFIIESPGFLLQQSGLSNLRHLASIRGKIGIDEVRESMNIVGLDPSLKKQVGKYSMGMRQRLGIAQAIMEKPRLLILDEPMNGLDNQGVQHIRSVLKTLKENGTTILLASHFKEDIELLCDEVYQMDCGILTRLQ